ncbi:hypothetical protein RA210_U10207 [Rubrivivax sp. A210]|uniref:DUF4936 family protein n=1 Tax=Rubrivivax sp. A210 TaxID=2772301 RepID=UPI001917B09A|nr:DUF4936 family protein [Rubrivivax sp. A210]CAD5366202.1 hypothetical protein RA210_U10207 [Rubrivivax sp. A210]
MSGEIFVYWRVGPEAAPAAIAAARDFQAALQASHPGLAVRLYRRVDVARGQVTVMETYAAPDVVSEALLGRVREAAWCPAERHVEVFEALA